ncbi:MAG: hypothetical protein ABJL74_03055 [Parasphingorhabdus sp.]|uniref:hypothetical protein n=1 Tax=Parasphingorhabdus sp. TaxID=2709688 RepID=UPI0032999D0F
MSLFISNERAKLLSKYLALFALVVGLSLWQGWPLLSNYWFWWIDQKTLEATAMGTIVVPAVWGPLLATLGTIALVAEFLKNRSIASKSNN